MNKPKTWEEKNAWLNRNIAGTEVIWKGPGQYISQFANYEVLIPTPPHGSRSIQVKSATGEASLSELFEEVIREGSEKPLVVSHRFTRSSKTITIDPATLDITYCTASPPAPTA